MRLVCISDTHGDHRKVQVPEGDVLIHAGDVTGHGTESDFIDFLAWFDAHPHEYKLFIAGNHDLYLESNPIEAKRHVDNTGSVWLNDSGIDIEGVQFWGSPITLRFHDWAFMRNPGDDIEQHWTQIPQNTQVLITHGPPFGILDHVRRLDGSEEQTGCPQLFDTILNRSLKAHIFGHIHEEFGALSQHGVDFLNVSTMNQSYRIANPPVIYTL